MFNLNKIFPWLSIRSKLIIAFVGLSVVPLVLVGLHGIFSNIQMMERNALKDLDYDVSTIRAKTANFLSNIENDLRVLRSSLFLDRFLLPLENSPPSVNDDMLQHISAELLAFARTKAAYYQFRILNGEGDEILRIEDIEPADTVLDYRIVPLGQGVRSGNAYYLHLVKDLGENQVALAPAEILTQKNERVPVISFAIAVMGAESFAGILVANVLAKDLFSVLEAGKHREVNRNVVLVTGDGHFLYHSERKKDWNKLLASREEDNLQNEYPAPIVTKIISGADGTVLDGIDDIISYAPLFPVEGTAPGGKLHSRFAMPLFVFESVPKDAIMGPVYSFAQKFTGFLFLFFVIAIGLGLLATRQFTKPIAALQSGAEIIAKGNYGHRIRVDTRDEIEKLATQFNSMAVSLEAHEREIQQHRALLEEKVKQRTHELSEEKAKLQAIVNNVPSAFVLLDKDFHIQTASAAIGSITGDLLHDVKGLECSAVICRNGFCRDCISRQALVTGGIESHIDRTLDEKGDERFIEHTAIPLKENGEIISILEIITDVTERKRLQERLVQTEKLMAVGQMSSLIAHEFRNSLTSIKMILQLQTESEKLSQSDKKSLSVALKSINQMESIVTELLNFARPKPMKFSFGSLNEAIDESLSLAQPHINKSGIAVKKKLDPTLPAVLIDASHFKEALVNLYLNAVQAIDSQAQEAHRKEISIVTRKTRLRNTLKEFYPGAGTEEAASAGRDIMLRSGTECAVLEISDTGSGIEQMQLSRVFDPFFTTKSSGTGLGLPMVKRTVNAHGGIIDMRSKTGEGTTFIIYLPLPHEEKA